MVTFSKVLAPFLPFQAEALYQNLVVEPGCHEADQDSVHLCDWPAVNAAVIDEELEVQVAWTRDVVRLGRRLRERQRLKTRQPLKQLTIVHHDVASRAAIESHAELIADELNVKVVEVLAQGDDLATFSCKPNFKTLGRRYGKQMKEAAQVIGGWSAAEFAQLEAGEAIEVLGHEVTADDVVVRREPKGELQIETEGALIVALDTQMDEPLLREGIARELVSAVQKQRKDQGFAVTDRIVVRVATADEPLRNAIEHSRDWISGEVLAKALDVVDPPAGDPELQLSTVAGTHGLSLTLEADAT